MNFWYNMQPFYDIENLNTYPSVNPARERGQQLMDAGRVYFADGTGLDMKKAMGFKNLDLYCVCPIVNGNAQLASYDFWAVVSTAAVESPLTSAVVSSTIRMR